MHRITFVMLMNISEGRGTERFTYYLIKNKSDDFAINVLQPDNCTVNRLTEDELKTVTDNSNMITYHYKNKFNNKFRNMLLHAISDIYHNFYNNKYNQILNAIKMDSPDNFNDIIESDFIYLYLNKFAKGFKINFKNSNKIIMGTNHTFKLDEYCGFSKLKKHIVQLADNNFLKYINAYHYFKSNEKYLKCLDVEKNLLCNLGVETSLFHPEEHKNKKIKFFFVASLIYGKGLDILLPVIDYFKDNSDIEFHIAGSGPLENEIAKRDYIKFYKNPNDNKLAELYRKMDIFIYTSHNDTYSLVVLQALSSGLYVLRSDYLKGIFDDFEGKYLKYIINQKEYYIDQIKNIIENENLINHDKNEEHTYVKQNYDWEKISVKFYRSLRNIKNMEHI